MIIAFTFLASLFVAYGQNNLPGRAIFWSPTVGKESKPQYQTQTSSFNEVSKLLKENLPSKEILVTFCSENSDSNEFYMSSLFSAEIQQSGDATILPNVYNAAKSTKTSICEDILKSDGLNTKIATPSEILDMVSNSEILSNNQLESFLVQIPSNIEADMSTYKSLFSKLNSPHALFLALQNPSTSAPVSGNYHRILSSDIEDGVNYLPEGSEFSIYYQAQYLYLTPDIFTGIMTGLFMAITLLIGYNCMGSIQGSSTYPTVLPPLGKEG